MKKFGIVLSAAFGLAALSANANPAISPEVATKALSAVHQVLAAQNVINWKVGDFHNIDVEFDGYGNIGEGRKEANKEETDKNAVWFKNEINVMGQSQTVESLIDRATGKELRRIVNGTEESVGGDEGSIDVIEESETEITVPAGKFDALYIKAKVTQGGQTQEVELWANPRDVNLDGVLKMSVNTAQGKISLILREFGSR